MSRIGAVLRRAVADLDAAGVRVALVGGLAVSVRSEPRFTRDVDLVVEVVDDEEAEALIRGLVDRGYRLLSTLEQTDVNRLATARLVPPGEGEEGVVLDLLFASSGLEGEIVAAAERIEVFRGVRVPVATAPHLVALKVLARDDRGRPQDLADLRALLALSGPRDVAAIRAALGRIAERGYHRRRELLADFEALVDAE